MPRYRSPSFPYGETFFNRAGASRGGVCRARVRMGARTRLTGPVAASIR